MEVLPEKYGSRLRDGFDAHGARHGEACHAHGKQNLKQSLDGTGEVDQACEAGVSTIIYLFIFGGRIVELD